MSTMIDTDVAAGLLREHSLRVTAPRVAVLRELSAHPHADVDTITRATRERLGSVSTQAVYDILGALAAQGMVRKFEPAGHPARYELELGDNHHHLVCRACGSLTDVDCAVGGAPCLTPAGDEHLTHGFVVDEAEVIYWGLCAACAQGSDDPNRTT